MTGIIPENLWEKDGNPIDRTAVRLPGEATQIGCVYCLAQEKVNAPVPGGIVYYWQGTSMCSTHIEKYAGKE